MGGDKPTRDAWKASRKEVDRRASGREGLIGKVISILRGGKPR